MIAISQLTLSLNKKPVLDRIDMMVSKGEIFGLTGLNGSGKSVLLKVLATILKPDNGMVKISGYDIVKNVNQVRGLIGYMPDDAACDDRLSVEEHLEFFYSMYKGDKQGYSSIAGELMDVLALNEIRSNILSALSRVEKQKVSFARAVIHDPLVLLLDDPDIGADLENQERIETVLKERIRRGKSIVVTSRSVKLLNSIAHRIGVLHDGSLQWIFPAGVENQESIDKKIEGLK
jgi:sodium transport system ATP-binding protein